MNSNICLQANLVNSQSTSTQTLALDDESREERVSRLYASPGGPLIGWLFDECRRRRQEYREMAACLGVTYGYVNQLRSFTQGRAQYTMQFSHYDEVPANVAAEVKEKLA